MPNLDTTEYAAGKLRAALAEQRRTARELATELGISPQAAARRLNGTTPLDVAELAKASNWLKISVEDFIPATVTVR